MCVDCSPFAVYCYLCSDSHLMLLSYRSVYFLNRISGLCLFNYTSNISPSILYRTGVLYVLFVVWEDFLYPSMEDSFGYTSLVHTCGHLELVVYYPSFSDFQTFR